ncbi:MAG: transposase, partial [Clostridia bacterium]
MAKRETDVNWGRLIREMIAEYDIKTIADLEKTLKEMFAGTMSDMLKGELDAQLGYEKSSQAPKETKNRRNGSYAKQIKTSMGETEINI